MVPLARCPRGRERLRLDLGQILFLRTWREVHPPRTTVNPERRLRCGSRVAAAFRFAGGVLPRLNPILEF